MENPKNLQEGDIREENVSTFTCEICVEPVPSNKKFTNKGGCVHPFCTDCMAKYIHVKVEDGVANIKCPGLNCNNLLDPITCRKLIPEMVLDKWCDRLCDSILLELEMCYCPYSDCSAPIVNECGGVVKKAECPNCKRSFCFQCKLPWHAGYRCSDNWDVRDENNILFKLLMERKKWSRCPRCGLCVERIAGCSSVTCRCRTRFCYHCGKKFNKTMCGCKRRLNHDQVWILTSFIVVVGVIAFLYQRICASGVPK